eukprot:COSAG05_NODE_7976_length_750_cov_0.705069_2_plen_68_part_01
MVDTCSARALNLLVACKCRYLQVVLVCDDSEICILGALPGFKPDEGLPRMWYASPTKLPIDPDPPPPP